MKSKRKRNRAHEAAAAWAKERAEAEAARAAASIGPHKLSELEYQVYQLFEPRPRSADPAAIRAELRSAAGREQGAVPGPAPSLAEVEAAVAGLEEQGYIEPMPASSGA